MFITSERVIQFQQRSLFDEKIQSIDLDGIEDVSSHQVGMVASLFNFGNVRLSTVGDETTYEQNLVYNPKRIVEQINNIVQAVKNDRLVPTKLGEPQFPLI
jgi:predicted membrane-bound spermidine synthase